VKRTSFHRCGKLSERPEGGLSAKMPSPRRLPARPLDLLACSSLRAFERAGRRRGARHLRRRGPPFRPLAEASHIVERGALHESRLAAAAGLSQRCASTTCTPSRPFRRTRERARDRGVRARSPQPSRRQLLRRAVPSREVSAAGCAARQLASICVEAAAPVAGEALPGIDILGGSAVRLVKATSIQEVYERPFGAQGWVNGGARSLHVVDLMGEGGRR